MKGLGYLTELTYYRGRVGLAEILKGLGVGKGDEVATQAFTCAAVPEGIMATGAIPKWVDIEPGGVNMDPKSLKERLGEKVKAVVVQHTFGIPAQLEELITICQTAGVPLIEDCCHTFASTYQRKTVGEFGVGAFYSFEWGKPLVAGLGGAARANSAELGKALRESYGKMVEPPSKSRLKIEAQYFGFKLLYSPKRFWTVRSIFQKLSASGAAEGNYHAAGETSEDFGWGMAPACKSRLLGAVKSAEETVDHARRLVEVYEGGLTNEGLAKVFVPEGANAVYARYPRLVNDKAGLVAKAQEKNIEVAEWYSTVVHPLGTTDFAAVHLDPAECPEAVKRASEIVSFPVNAKTRIAMAKETVEFLNSVKL